MLREAHSEGGADGCVAGQRTWVDLLASRRRFLDLIDNDQHAALVDGRLVNFRDEIRAIDAQMITTLPQGRRDVLAALGALIDGDYTSDDSSEPDWRIIGVIARAAWSLLR